MAPSANDRQTIFSGIQATGVPMLGNYLGAMRNWVNLQDEYNCIYCVVDLHSLTIRQDPATLRRRARELMTLYIAAGLDPEKNTLYFQSHVPAHAELSWILGCFTYMGELSRMTQFKDKSQKHADNINAGLFTYPVLMAADILLYQADLVPVGEDQRQHLELSRDIAQRMNNLFGPLFTVPEAYYGKVGARIMSLQEPTKKMSKSETENMNNTVFMLDPPEVIRAKFKRAVTDSGAEVRFAEDKPGVSNLLTIYCAAAGVTAAEAEKEFAGQGYGPFKTAVGEAVAEMLAPIQRRFNDLSKEKDYIDGIITSGAEKAAAIAGRTLKQVKKKIGLPV